MAITEAELRRERLVALDPLPARIRDRCEAEIRKLLVRKLSPVLRLWGWTSVLGNLVIAWGLLARAVGYGEPLDQPTELVVASAVLLLGVSSWIAYVLVRGSIHILRDQPWMDAIGCLGMVAMGAVLLRIAWQGDDLAASLRLTGYVALLLGGTAVALFLSIRRRRLIDAKVKRLEGELHLCERASRPEQPRIERPQDGEGS
jgi:hypothetical protein